MSVQQFTIRLADKCVGVTCLYPSTREFCEGYTVTREPDFSIAVTREDIEYERQKSLKTSDYPYRDKYLETLAIYRKITEIMPRYDTILFHGSAVSVDGAAYLFTASSGTGKSTHTRLWREYLGDRAVMINDDKPLIRVTDTGAVVYGTPWNGKHMLGTNSSAPLKTICILERGETNEIHRITKAEAFTMLVQQAYRPSDPAAMMKTMEIVDKLADSVKLYRLKCNMEIQAAQVAYNAMKGE